MAWVRRIAPAAGIGLLTAGLMAQGAPLAQEGTGARGGKTVETAELKALERKLDKLAKEQQTILETQQTILARFDAVMEELRIIKVRATLSR